MLEPVLPPYAMTISSQSTTSSEPLISREQHQQFWRDGYFVFNTQVPHATCDRIVRDIAEHYPPDDKPDGYVTPTRLQDAWTFNEDVREVATNPRILAVLQELYGRKPLPFQTLNFPTGTQQFPHSDTIHFNSLPHTFMCGVWVAFEDIDMDNGPLIYYPGSNMLPEFTMADAGAPEAHSRHYAIYEQFIQKVITEFELKPAYGTIKKGEALIWSSNLIHGGAPQRDRARSRHSEVTHFYFEGCRYYTPMDSLGTHVHWRQPEWIAPPKGR
ncbi:MAG TPA: phytanoyl-CoA dioxygenase family protein [Planctomycetota bacterium]|nr:phytanoyl-CoA dioxygenase family protein [Planctomycetota bacterium]